MKDKERYIRQINLPQVGETGQEKLNNAKILIIGAGGLGNAILPYLVASGIGNIGIMDGDTVAYSNLHRQVLFTEKNLGKNKSNVAKKKLRAINKNIHIESFPNFLTGDNALALFKEYDVIVDATDSIEARYLINDACALTAKPFVHASLYRFQIQVSVFNYQNGPTYRCLFPKPPTEAAQSCAEAGILGTTVAYAGTLQANEILKIILNIGDVLSGKLLLVDTLTNQQNIFTFPKKSASITEEFFRKEHQYSNHKIAFASTNKENGVFLDVRGPEEIPEIKNSNSLQISLNELEESLRKLPKEKPVYIFCQSGKRSSTAYKILKQNDFKNMYCLEENAPELVNLLK